MLHSICQSPDLELTFYTENIISICCSILNLKMFIVCGSAIKEFSGVTFSDPYKAWDQGFSFYIQTKDIQHSQTDRKWKNKLIIAWFLIHDKLDVSMSLFPLLESYFCHHQQRQCAEVSCYPLISWIDFLFKIDTNFWFQLLCHLSLFHYLFSTGCDRILPYIYKSLAYKIVIYEALD